MATLAGFQLSRLYERLAWGGINSKALDRSWYMLEHAERLRLNVICTKFENLLRAVEETQYRAQEFVEAFEALNTASELALLPIRKSIDSILALSAHVGLKLAARLGELAYCVALCEFAMSSFLTATSPVHRRLTLRSTDNALAAGRIGQTGAAVHVLLEVEYHLYCALRQLQTQEYGMLLTWQMARPNPLEFSCDPFPPLGSRRSSTRAKECPICGLEMKPLEELALLSDSPAFCCLGFVRLSCGHSFGLPCLAGAPADEGDSEHRCPLCEQSIFAKGDFRGGKGLDKREVDFQEDELSDERDITSQEDETLVGSESEPKDQFTIYSPRSSPI